jgi:ATP-dependent DNA helicase RecG
LAEQHFATLQKFIEQTGFMAAILTGATKTKDKRDIKTLAASGNIHFIVGTHALLQENVEFHRLGFAVIDEQHRFGVKQRKTLTNKGVSPDILLMSATPIPRTLALTYYGDLDLSEINEMPPGRLSPVTKVFRHASNDAAYKYVEECLKDGDRAYFVYPVIEENKSTKLKSVVKSFETVKERFPQKKAGLLHGRLKSAEKTHLLEYFRTGRLDILVSTTVVEVGVDVKDATVILIEDADRFGLAQLHQLRGRVGRSDKQSYCILVATEEITDSGYSRLRAMEQYTSGFKLAELDLKLRGHGDFFGIKQSGLPEFQFTDIIRDTEIMNKAKLDADALIEEDPSLTAESNQPILSVLKNRWRDEYDLFNTG